LTVKGVALSQSRQAAFVLVATDHGSMIINKNDYCTGERGTFGVGYEILRNSNFSLNECLLIIQLLTKRQSNFPGEMIAIDVGANYGTHTLAMARTLTGCGKVIAIEPQERIYYALCGNVALNNLMNVTAIRSAVGSHNGIIKIPVPDYLAPASYGSLELIKSDENEIVGQVIDYSDSATVPVTLMTIDSLLLDRCDLLKIDAEGMEMFVMEGAAKTVTNHKPILFIEAFKIPYELFMDTLKRFGYTAFYTIGLNVVAFHADDPTKECMVHE